MTRPQWICPRCWHLMPRGRCACSACGDDWAGLFERSSLIPAALDAAHWPSRLVIAVDDEQGLHEHTLRLPVSAAITADGAVERIAPAAAPDAEDVAIVRAEKNQVTLDRNGHARSEIVPPCRFALGTRRVALRLEAEPPAAVADITGTAPIPFAERPIPSKAVSVLGRRSSCDVCLPAESIAPQHALLVRENEDLWIVGMSGAALVTVEGAPVIARRLRADDWLRVGGLSLLFDGRCLRQPARIAGARVVIRDLQLRPGRGLRWRRRGAAVTIAMPEALELPAGALIGLVGPSGIGKTTLLRTIAGLRRTTRGNVRIDSDSPGGIGYVPQDDVVHRSLSVRDVLTYTARLRLRASSAQIASRVSEVAVLVSLTDRLDHRVNALSGGQRKRVSIGVELLARPPLLLLDEPGSGLDPGTERTLMRRLRNLSRCGQTVVLTTHVFESVDLLDGLIVFARRRGAPGKVEPRWFADLGALRESLGVHGVSELFEALQRGWPVAAPVPGGLSA